MNEIWTTEEEARRLRDRFNAIKKEGVSQAKFAEDEKFPGGRSMVNQNLKGHRPITLDAAVIYARYFKCGLHEISPRLANGVSLASLVTNQPLAPADTAQQATKDVAIEDALKALSFALEQSNPAMRDALAGMLSSLAKTPEQPALWDSLGKLLTPEAFARATRKAA